MEGFLSKAKNDLFFKFFSFINFFSQKFNYQVVRVIKSDKEAHERPKALLHDRLLLANIIIIITI